LLRLEHARTRTAHCSAATAFLSHILTTQLRTAICARRLWDKRVKGSIGVLRGHTGKHLKHLHIQMQANYIHDYLYIPFNQCYTVQPSEQIDDLEIFGAAYCIVPARIACKLVLFCSYKFFNMRAYCSAHTKKGSVTTVEMAGSAPGSLLISGSADRAVMVWDTRATARGAMHCLNGHQDRVTRSVALLCQNYKYC
jgi:WD40 repeat protein